MGGGAIDVIDGDPLHLPQEGLVIGSNEAEVVAGEPFAFDVVVIGGAPDVVGVGLDLIDEVDFARPILEAGVVDLQSVVIVPEAAFLRPSAVFDVAIEAFGLVIELAFVADEADLFEVILDGVGGEVLVA